MRKLLLYIASTIILYALLNGCLKDKCTQSQTYTIYEPVYKTTAEVRANIKSNVPRDIQQPGKLFLLGNYIFLNEIDKGIHVIDNSNPSDPKNIAFIDIPGNMDIAVKGNTLYADCYTDLAILDITNPLQVVAKKFIAGVFPFRVYNNGFIADSSRIITDWKKTAKKITVNCSSGLYYADPLVFALADNAQAAFSASAASSPFGVGGSMARFSIVNNFLYTVSDMDLNVFNITNDNDPSFSNKVHVDWHVETIYPFKDKLFVGSNSGMYMYNIQASPSNPVPAGQFTHVRSCDPVIADDNYAYVTLSSGTACLGYNNELDVVNIHDISNASLVKVYPFTHPQGLSKDGNLLFVCDGPDGLKVYNAGDVNNLQLIKQLKDAAAYDVIAYKKVAIMIGKDGLYQYDYSDVNNIHLLSKLAINKN